MDRFIEIYTTQAEAYHRAITAEDVDGRLLPALESVAPLRGARVLDLGSGTGRLPLLFAGLARQVVALDLHRAMLREQQQQRDVIHGHWPLVQGDMRRLPFPSASFNLVTAGWAIGHLTGWYPDAWRAEISRVLSEMHRVALPGGALIIIETLTTGSLTPAPPTPALTDYYLWLENDWRFTRQEIRTDYQFASVEEAVARTEFFFGPSLSVAIRKNGWARLPEWTGVWGKRV